MNETCSESSRKFSSSFSRRDISELIRSWMGQQSFREYEEELQAASGPGFQMRLLDSDRQVHEFSADKAAHTSLITDAVNSSLPSSLRDFDKGLYCEEYQPMLKRFFIFSYLIVGCECNFLMIITARYP